MVEQQGELSRALHDDVGPALAAIRVSVAACKRQPDSLQRCLDTIDASAASLDRWATQSRSLTHAALVHRAGLEDAFHWYAAYLEREQRGRLELHYEGDEVPFEPALAIFALVAEEIARASADPQKMYRLSVRASEIEVNLRLLASGPGTVSSDESSADALLRALGGSVETIASPDGYEILLRVPLSNLSSAAG